MIKTIVRSSSHRFSKDINAEKHKTLNQFLKECRRVLQIYVDHIWNEGITYEVKVEVVNKNGKKGKKKKIEQRICCPSMGYFDLPSFFDYNQIKVETTLSARARSSLTSQAMALISAATKKHAQRQYKINEFKKDPLKNAENISRLQRTILKKQPLKPMIDTTENSTLAIELSSKCAMMTPPGVKDGEFNYFLRLQSMGKAFETIYIPIRDHKHSLKLKKMGTTLGSFLIGNNEINIRYRIEVEQRKIGETVGGDTGKKTVLTLSDNNSTDMKADVHGHTLSSVMESLARKKKGSKGFHRAQLHRTNYINWSIKQINFSSYKQINLEKINNIFYKNKTSRLMSHFTNADIEKAIISKCELDGVHLNFQSSMYRSQRCSGCGFVRKANRKGKLYKCKHCGIELDSDLNAAKNHAISLFSLPGRLRHLKLNLKGFYWKPDGLFNLDGSELRVPDTHKEMV